MGVLVGPFVVAALLLGLGGLLEVRRPAATVGAMRAMGLPTSPVAVRFGGAVAVAISVAAVVSPNRLVAGAIVLTYLLLSGFMAAALVRKTPLASCGCFGRADTPATPGHLVINLSATAVAAAVALIPGGRGWGAVDLDRGLVTVAVFVVLTATSTWFAYLILTLLPRLAADAGRTAGKAT